MMKRFRLQYLIAFACLMVLVSCQSDTIGEEGGEVPADNNGKVKVSLTISPLGSAAHTRVTDWQDPNVNAGGLDEEMMNVWTVVMVNDNGNKVERIFVGKPTYTPNGHADDNREIDQVATDLELTEGASYHIYSFANIAPSQVFSLLHLNLTDYADPTNDEVKTFETSAISGSNDAGTTSGGEAVVKPKPATGGNDNDYVDDITVTMKANGKSYSDLTATDNPFGFGSKGIPMSNVQTFTVPAATASETDRTKDLIVVRMFAKMEIPIYNESATAFKLTSLTISGITKNDASNNLMLLPTLTDHDKMDATHGDIKATTPDGNAADFVYTLANPTIDANKKYADGTPAQTLAFYINESRTPSDNGGLFKITLQLEDETTKSTTELRYALISKSGNASGYSGDWDYIARNDYRVIPIVLDDVRYRLDLVPYDFPAIGVYPSSVEELESGTNPLYQINFHDYGHFHLVPKVTKIVGSTTAEIPFAKTRPTASGSGFASTVWSLIDEDGTQNADDWTASWKSYKADKTTAYAPSDAATVAFYGERDAYGAAKYTDLTTYSYPSAVDASENGNFPVLDTETVWNGCNTGTLNTPYIFGQIAPHDANADVRVYHEFTIRVYPKGKSLPYELTYRFYMHLKQDHATARRRTAAH